MHMPNEKNGIPSPFMNRQIVTHDDLDELKEKWGVKGIVVIVTEEDIASCTPETCQRNHVFHGLASGLEDPNIAGLAIGLISGGHIHTDSCGEVGDNIVDISSEFGPDSLV